MNSWLSAFFDFGQFGNLPLPAHYHFGLVLLSYLTALTGSYTALRMLDRARAYTEVETKTIWLVVTAMIGGIAVWSMHFIGMMAYEVPIPMSYSLSLTLLSIIPAMIGVGITFGLQIFYPQQHVPNWVCQLGGAVLGAGIGAMHYIGMAAMLMPAELRYDPLLFALSIVTAVGLGIVAAYSYRASIQRAQDREKPSSRSSFFTAIVISVAISGMHYIAMFAARLYAPSSAIAPSAEMHSDWLPVVIVVGVCILAFFGFVASRIDLKMVRNLRLLRMSGAQLYEVIGAIDDAVMLFNSERKLVLCNDAVSNILGYSQKDIVNRQLLLDDYLVDGAAIILEIRETLVSKPSWRGEVNVRHSDGHPVPVRLSVSIVQYNDSNEHHYVILMTDLTQQKQSEAHIRQLAFEDSVTALPNRRALLDELDRLLKRQHYGTLLLIDIDKFKALNNTMGTKAGDDFLRQFGARLRASFDDDCVVARVASNEFAVACSKRFSSAGSDELHEIRNACRMLQAEIAEPFQLRDYQHSCSVTMGVTQLRQGVDANQLMIEASLALSQAKKEGPASVVIYYQGLATAISERVVLEQELRAAISDNELRLYLQPQVDTDGKIIGAEGLLRWPHPTRGWISPGQFIPLAEESGLIVALGDWVADQALEILERWQSQPHLANLILSINVSAPQFQQPDFTSKMRGRMNQHPGVQSRLKLELTESVLMENIDSTIDTLHQLKQHGVLFALDDFGTGYSSLSYLMRIPFDTLKIDVAFVRDMHESAQKAAIVRTITELSRVLSMDTIAEGVERPEQRHQLESLGCHIYQGFLYSPAVSLEEFEKLVG
ncbi:EAL domain-containing protein [Idiomarina tyrosinivorans]|nr:EAL domain-containing protein [Idiomarina tyrosinivorans]